jgi:hypothetical protein
MRNAERPAVVPGNISKPAGGVMGSFSIWHWLIVLLVIGLPVALAVTSAKRKVNSAGQPEGFGGWLLLLAIGQTLTPLRSLGDFVRLVPEYQQVMAIENGPPLVYSEVALTVAYIALQIAVTVFMFRRSSLFPRLYFWQWIALPIYFVLDGALIHALLDIGTDQLFTAQEIGGLAAAFVINGLWVWYVSASVRVRNTFGSKAELATTFA